MTVDQSAVARIVGISTSHVNLRGGALYLPQRIAVFAQGRSDKTYPLTKFQATSHRAVGERLGWGSPAHRIAKRLHPDNGDGVGTIPVTYYPLEDAYEAVLGTGSITPTGSQTKAAQYRMKIGGVRGKWFTIDVGESVASVCDKIVASVNGVLDMPVTAVDQATRVDFRTVWAGLSANGVKVEIEGDLFGMAFAVVDTTGGLINPDVTDALALVGDVWETFGLNALNFDDTDALDAFQEFGEGRWLFQVGKPIVVVRGCTEADWEDATAVTAERTDDRVNCQLVGPGSSVMPFEVAARELVRIVKMANDNPPHDYGSQQVADIEPGADELQWNWTTRDAAVKAGSSTAEVRDGVVTLSDTVTSWAPEGEEPPAYRYVCDIVKIMQVIFNLRLRFNNPEWDGAPWIPDSQPTVNPTAKQPKMWIASANEMLDSLGLQAIIADAKTAKKNTTCVPSSQNPKRYDAKVRFAIAGNVNIGNIEQEWGFYYPAA